VSTAAIAAGVKAILAAARRAHERGDTDERDRLLDEADGQLGLMADSLPVRPSGRESRRP
jgi:uncharacterized protein HemY